MTRRSERTPLRYRPNQSELTADGWWQLRDAFQSLSWSPPARGSLFALIDAHERSLEPGTARVWGARTMRGVSVGRNFLPWHRAMLCELEQRLRAVDSAVELPYWDWATATASPDHLNDTDYLLRCSVERPGSTLLPLTTSVEKAFDAADYPSFSRAIEELHGVVHAQMGGTIATAQAPLDLLYWLALANVDRLWSLWSLSASPSPERLPANGSERLKPPGLLRFKVKDVLSTDRLGYAYR